MAAKVTISNNGPILVSGDFELLDAEGKAYGLAGRATIALCRCGHSQNKPFCDGSHKSANFQSSVHAHELAPLKPKA
jgi:CDGSH-type Zn-finger protein